MIFKLFFTFFLHDGGTGDCLAGHSRSCVCSTSGPIVVVLLLLEMAKNNHH